MTERPLARYLALSLAVALLAACAPQTKVVQPGGAEADKELSQGYSALHGLMKKEAKADQILMLKTESDELEAVIKDITRRAGEAADQLEEFVEQDPKLTLSGEDLPVIEAATRKAIEWTKTKDLLFSGGEAFQKDFILSQIQGTNYAAHLAEVLAKNDPNPERTEYLNQLSADFIEYHTRLREMLSLKAAE